MRCLKTGMYAHWQLTAGPGAARSSISRSGMDPAGFSDRVFDRIAGKTYFRRWAEQSLDALQGAAQARV